MIVAIGMHLTLCNVLIALAELLELEENGYDK